MAPRHYQVPLASLQHLTNPLNGFLTDGYVRSTITREEVLQQIKDGAVEKEPWTVLKRRMFLCQVDRAFHARRIAYFVQNGVPVGDPHPIVISLGLKRGEDAKENALSVPFAQVQRGKHRVAAAFLRNDDAVEAVLEDPKCLLDQGFVLTDAILLPRSRVLKSVLSARVRHWTNPAY